MFLYFVSESPNLTRIQTHQLPIGNVTLIKYKDRQLYDKGLKNLLQSIYRVVHVYPSLALIIFPFF